jgi:hypothetical protein
MGIGPAPQGFPGQELTRGVVGIGEQDGIAGGSFQRIQVQMQPGHGVKDRLGPYCSDRSGLLPETGLGEQDAAGGQGPQRQMKQGRAAVTQHQVRVFRTMALA